MRDVVRGRRTFADQGHAAPGGACGPDIDVGAVADIERRVGPHPQAFDDVSQPGGVGLEHTDLRLLRPRNRIEGEVDAERTAESGARSNQSATTARTVSKPSPERSAASRNWSSASDVDWRPRSASWACR